MGHRGQVKKAKAAIHTILIFWQLDKNPQQNMKMKTFDFASEIKSSRGLYPEVSCEVAAVSRTSLP